MGSNANVGRMQKLTDMYETFIKSLPYLLNIGSLLFLVGFIFAILGVNLFGDVTCDNGLDDRNNFRNAAQSGITLFRILTGDDWHELLMAVGSPGFECNGPHDIRPPHVMVGILYIMAFFFISSFIMIELYTAVILENFQPLEEGKQKLFDGILDWTTKWEDVDFKSRGKLTVEQFLE